MKKSLWMPFLALTCSMFFSITVFAGDINGAEQSIISTVSGTYEYEGAYYKVESGYIAKVSDYLSQDGVNMTDAQANAYIAQFYDSFATGISAGYLVKIGDVESSDDTSSDDSDTGDGDSTEGNKESGSSDKKGSSGNGNGGTGSSTENAGTGDTNSDGNTETGDANSDGSAETGKAESGGNTEAGDTDTAGSRSEITTVENDDLGTITQIPSGGSGTPITLPDADSVTGIFNQSGTEDGVIEDNTIGSTTDGEIEYTVFPMNNETMYVWDVDTLEVHKEAYKDSDVIGTLNKGDAVAITGAATTGWAQIQYDDTVGYVSAVYLRTQGFMDSLEEEAPEDVKDYSDAAPVKKSFNFVTIAIVIAIVCIIAAAGIIIWHRNKSRKR